MKRLSIERGLSTDAGTFGMASIDSTIWHSLELPWRDNQHGISCIPPGVYTAKWIDAATLGAPHLGMVYHVLDVPGRTGILLHRANWAGDTAKGYHSDLEGCLSIGEATGELIPPGRAEPQMALERSGPAFDALFAITGGADIEVEVKWQAGADPGSYDAPTVA
jgi:hypothetical protein